MKEYQFLKKIIWILTFFVLVIFVLYYFVFKDIEQKNKSTSDLQNNIAIQIQRDQYTKSVESIIGSAQNSIDVINNSIIGKDNDVVFIENLEIVALDNGLTISFDSLSNDDLPDLANTNMTTLNIRATAKGAWSSSYTFLKELEALPFVFKEYRACIDKNKPFNWKTDGHDSFKGYKDDKKRQILEARKLKGEPEDFDFLKKDNLQEI